MMPEKTKEAESIGAEVKGELTRREVIKLSAGAAIAATVVGLDLKALAQAAQEKAPLFFTKPSILLLTAVTLAEILFHRGRSTTVMLRNILRLPKSSV